MNKIINLDYIKTFNPCHSGLENLIKHHESFEGSMSDFLQLDNVPYSDKIWLSVKCIDIKILNQWSVNCAEFVLDNFESQFPDDTRVRDCINITNKYLLGDATLDELTAAWSAGSAARSARYAGSAVESAAESAAWSAESAARSARYAGSAWSAAWSARYAGSAARSAAWSARSAARSAGSAARSAEKEQENINLSLLIALL